MNLSSLPRYPGQQHRDQADQPGEGDQRLTPRRARVLMDLGWLVVILALLWWLGRTTDAIEHPRGPTPPRSPLSSPLDFRVVEQRYDSVPLFGSREEVERLLGPPTEHYAFGPELAEAERALANGGRNVMPRPADRVWDRWSDPADQRRWVAVLYGGYSASAKVYGVTKRGF